MLEIEGLVPIQELLEIKIERTSVALADNTSVCSKLAVVHVADGGTSCLIHTDTGIESELEILQELNLGISRSVDGITLRVISVESNCSQGVHITVDRTRETRIHTITEVIHLQSV